MLSKERIKGLSDYDAQSLDRAMAALYAFAGIQIEPFGFCVMDAASLIRVCNRKFATLFGYSPEACEGLHMSALIAPGQPHPHGTPDAPTNMATHVKRGESMSLHEGELTLRALHKDGHELHVVLMRLRGGETALGEFIMTGHVRAATVDEIAAYQAKFDGYDL